MNRFNLITDSACDIPAELLEQWDVAQISMSYMFETDDTEQGMEIKEFYDRMRNGQVAKTSAINPDVFYSYFKPLLQNGSDILYLSFSSGLSTTCNSAHIAARDLQEEFPQRKIAVVDSLCASAGQGLFVYLVAQEGKKCQTLEDLARFAEDLKLHICHWFTVDELVYLKRGGRISPAIAFVGCALGIKPILHVDNEGHLINVGKTRGRKASIAAIANQYSELALDPSNGTVFISNGDCQADAELLAQMLKERHGVSVQLITDIGPVIGAHSGPGTLALFFVGKER